MSATASRALFITCLDLRRTLDQPDARSITPRRGVLLGRLRRSASFSRELTHGPLLWLSAGVTLLDSDTAWRIHDGVESALHRRPRLLPRLLHPPRSAPGRASCSLGWQFDSDVQLPPAADHARRRGAGGRLSSSASSTASAASALSPRGSGARYRLDHSVVFALEREAAEALLRRHLLQPLPVPLGQHGAARRLASPEGRHHRRDLSRSFVARTFPVSRAGTRLCTHRVDNEHPARPRRACTSPTTRSRSP